MCWTLKCYGLFLDHDRKPTVERKVAEFNSSEAQLQLSIKELQVKVDTQKKYCKNLMNEKRDLVSMYTCYAQVL